MNFIRGLTVLCREVRYLLPLQENKQYDNVHRRNVTLIVTFLFQVIHICIAHRTSFGCAVINHHNSPYGPPKQKGKMTFPSVRRNKTATHIAGGRTDNTHILKYTKPNVWNNLLPFWAHNKAMVKRTKANMQRLGLYLPKYALTSHKNVTKSLCMHCYKVYTYNVHVAWFGCASINAIWEFGRAKIWKFVKSEKHRSNRKITCQISHRVPVKRAHGTHILWTLSGRSFA